MTFAFDGVHKRSKKCILGLCAVVHFARVGNMVMLLKRLAELKISHAILGQNQLFMRKRCTLGESNNGNKGGSQRRPLTVSTLCQEEQQSQF